MSLDKLCKDVSSAVRSRLNSQRASVHHGRVTGSGIAVAGRVYPYSVAVDLPIAEGDWVYVILNETNTRAVVVGR